MTKECKCERGELVILGADDDEPVATAELIAEAHPTWRPRSSARGIVGPRREA